jgi:hypothetical protein
MPALLQCTGIKCTVGPNSVYFRKISVQYQAQGRLEPCPMKWLDNFAMRSFTNDPIFDDTLPVADGLLEAGTRVPLDRLQAALEDWFKRKGYLEKGASLTLSER